MGSKKKTLLVEYRVVIKNLVIFVFGGVRLLRIGVFVGAVAVSTVFWFVRGRRRLRSDFDLG